jgi:ferredoxin--NADP+ reductase
MGHGFSSFLLNAFAGRRHRLEPGLTPGSSWIIHLYTNELADATGDLFQRPVTQDQAAGSREMSNFNLESVLSVHHWTDTLFSFTTTRDSSFRFRNGEFTMIGLKVGEKPLLRAYSVASANYEDRLEFFSIKVPDGPLTSRLQHLKQGDEVIVSRKATGTLVIDNLEDGRNLYLIGTGTGLAPFLSVIKDPETYERFEKVVLLHGCRRVAELAYGEMITEKLPKDELIGDLVRNQLIYYPTVTRDPFRNRGRITDLINSGKLFSDAGVAPLEAEHDRVMICGSPALVHDTRALLLGKDFREGNHGEPGQFVVEKAFAER